MQIWRIIPEIPSHYEVSNKGYVRSWLKKGGRGKLDVKPHLVKFDTVHGYKKVRLVVEGKVFSFRVNRLVLLAFKGLPPTSQHEAAHLDNDKTNNHVKNLRWVTSKVNKQHSLEAGLFAVGSRNGRSKLTEEQVCLIKFSDLPSSQLARKFDVSLSTINEIRRGSKWKYLTLNQREGAIA